MHEPKWPLIVQWDDRGLQVVGRDEWMRDPDISYWGQFFLIVDADGVLWTLVRHGREPANLVTSGERASRDRLHEAIEADASADPDEVEDWSVPGLARYIETLKHKFSQLPRTELAQLPLLQPVARSHRGHGSKDRRGNQVWSLDLPWLFGRRRAWQSRALWLDALRTHGDWYLTCAKDPSSTLGQGWAPVAQDTWRMPSDIGGTALAAWLTGGTWCLSRDVWLPFDAESHELDSHLRLFRLFRKGATVLVAGLGFPTWYWGQKAAAHANG